MSDDDESTEFNIENSKPKSSWFFRSKKSNPVSESDDEDENEYAEDEDEDVDVNLLNAHEKGPEYLIKTNKYNHKLLIKNYIKSLYGYLGEKYCFTSGAFVIQDDSNKLFTLLTENKQDYHKLIKGIRSHGTYKNSPSDPVYETHLSKLNNSIYELRCNVRNEFIHVKNVKWYPFEQNGHKFMYLKLERYGTITGLHAIAYLTVSGKKEKDLNHPFRREDCKDFKTKCRYDKPPFIGKNPFENWNKVVIDGHTYPVVEEYERRGDDVFIPEEVSTYIIDHIHDELIFKFTYQFTPNSTVTIINTSQIGGKIRKLRIKKRRTTKHKKRSTTKHKTRSTKYKKRSTKHKTYREINK
jgi:hypothetical protein